MKKEKIGELTPKEERELLMEFERMSRADTAASPPPTDEFERIISEMKKRNIIPQIREELKRKYSK